MSESRILLVEPAREIADEIALHLRLEGRVVVVCGTAAEALSEIARGGVSLVISEQVLPDMTGLELLRRVRDHASNASTPIMITAERDDEVERVVAFELGADDFVAKPFSVRELALRVRAILRRARPSPGRRQDVIILGPLSIDVSRHRAMVEGREVSLTRREMRLLVHLAGDAGRVHTREALLERVWRNRAADGSRAVDTAIKRLRRKLGPAGGWIETVRGVGYRVRHEGTGAMPRPRR